MTKTENKMTIKRTCRGMYKVGYKGIEFSIVDGGTSEVKKGWTVDFNSNTLNATKKDLLEIVKINIDNYNWTPDNDIDFCNC